VAVRSVAVRGVAVRIVIVMIGVLVPACLVRSGGRRASAAGALRLAVLERSGRGVAGSFHTFAKSHARARLWLGSAAQA